MEFVKIGAIAVAGVLLGIQFKSGRQEYGTYIGAVICLLIFSCTALYTFSQKRGTLHISVGRISLMDVCMSVGRKFMQTKAPLCKQK